MASGSGGGEQAESRHGMAWLVGQGMAASAGKGPGGWAGRWLAGRAGGEFKISAYSEKSLPPLKNLEGRKNKRQGGLIFEQAAAAAASNG